MNKAELKAELDKRGLAYDPESTNAVLEEILNPVLEEEKAKAEEAARVAEEAAEKAKADAEAVLASGGANSGLEISNGATITGTSNPSRKGEEAVDIIDMHGNYIRTYEGSRHGKDFMGMAQEFCSHPDHAVRGYHTEKSNPDRVVRN